MKYFGSGLGQRFKVKCRIRLPRPNLQHRLTVFPSQPQDHHYRRRNRQRRQQCNQIRHLGGNKKTFLEAYWFVARWAGRGF